ncbi:hypothetical protein Barb6_03947 [Bacteroidales bacterium Barb6]|nr:hypothetical protein Barb6_03947 [Bacteroidales bacterium Barb6]
METVAIKNLVNYEDGVVQQLDSDGKHIDFLISKSDDNYHVLNPVIYKKMIKSPK